MVAVLLVDVGLAIYILPKDPAMDLFIYSDGVQVDFTIGDFYFYLKIHEISKPTDYWKGVYHSICALY